jgi:hypothetical protein
MRLFTSPAPTARRSGDRRDDDRRRRQPRQRDRGAALNRFARAAAGVLIGVATMAAAEAQTA